MSLLKRPTIHYTQLAPLPPGSQLEEEWETYRREVGRLLAEGHEGRCVMIKGRKILGIWDTLMDAYTEGVNRFLGETFMVQPIRTQEPVIRIR